MRQETEHLRFLADATRLRILHLLAAEPLTVAELQEVLELSQSSVSGHLAKLKRGGYIHVQPEGSAHRYRLREDLPATQDACWRAVLRLTAENPSPAADRARLVAMRDQRSRTWVDRVAGSLHREYVPGRSNDGLLHLLLPFLRLGACLDVGAGDGSLIELLAPRVERLVCLEPNASMVEAGQRRIAELGIDKASYTVAGGERIPFPDESFDSVLSIQSLQYMDDPAAALAEAHRVLAPGGRLAVLTLLAHDFPEAERYGHRHRGFAPDRILSWLPAAADPACYPLSPEARPPGFVPLVCTATRS